MIQCVVLKIEEGEAEEEKNKQKLVHVRGCRAMERAMKGMQDRAARWGGSECLRGMWGFENILCVWIFVYCRRINNNNKKKRKKKEAIEMVQSHVCGSVLCFCLKW